MRLLMPRSDQGLNPQDFVVFLCSNLALVEQKDDRPDSLPLPNYRETGGGQHGCCVCSGRHALRQTRRDQVSFFT